MMAMMIIITMIIIIDDCDVDKDNKSYNIYDINDIGNETDPLDMERFFLMMMMMLAETMTKTKTFFPLLGIERFFLMVYALAFGLVSSVYL